MLHCSYCLAHPITSRKSQVARLLYGKRKNALHSFSASKPGVEALLNDSSMSGSSSAAFISRLESAFLVGELSRSHTLSLLRRYRKLKRLDRAIALYEWCSPSSASSSALAKDDLLVHKTKGGKAQDSPPQSSLWTTAHDAVLLAHVNDSGSGGSTFSSSLAQQIFTRATKNGQNGSHQSLNRALLGGLLTSYARQDDWKGALKAFEQHVLQDQRTTDSHHLHTVMNVCRRCQAWSAGIQVFQRAVGSGGQSAHPPPLSQPNAVVYLELLRLLAQSDLADKHHQALSILEALATVGEVPKSPQNRQANSLVPTISTLGSSFPSSSVIELTAGHYNAVFAALKPKKLYPLNIHFKNPPNRKSFFSLEKNNASHPVYSFSSVPPLVAQGVRVYIRMQERGVQPSRETLPSLFSLHPRHLEHALFCVGECHRLGMPVTADMYRSLLTLLVLRETVFRHGRALEKHLGSFHRDSRGAANHVSPLDVVQFVEAEYQRYEGLPVVLHEKNSPASPAPVPASPDMIGLHLSTALVDVLLSHPRPSEAQYWLSIFASRLRPILSPLTAGICDGLGIDASEISSPPLTFSVNGFPPAPTSSFLWQVYGRVAIVDHNTILSPLFESLAFHYDSVLVPFSVIRVLLRRLPDLRPNSKSSKHTRRAIRRLRKIVAEQSLLPAKGAESFSTTLSLRVIPLAHQLYAHRFLEGTSVREATTSSGSTGSPGRGSSFLPLKQHTPPNESESLSEQLLRALGDSEKEEEGSNTSNPNLIMKKENVSFSSTSKELSKDSPVPTRVVSCMRSPDVCITMPERVVALAGMIKTLNPNASVHVLSSSAFLKAQGASSNTRKHNRYSAGKVHRTRSPLEDAVNRWNQNRARAADAQHLRLTHVYHPTELSEKAPSELQLPPKND